MDKKLCFVLTHTQNRILLNHKKEHIRVSFSEVDEPRDCYTEWSKLEREKQILYVNTSLQTLEKWYWWTYLWDRNRDADIENRLICLFLKYNWPTTLH